MNPDLNCQLFVACWAVGCLCPRNLEDWCGYRPQIMYAFAKMVVAITKTMFDKQTCGFEPKLVWCQYPNKPSDWGYFPFSYWPSVRRNTEVEVWSLHCGWSSHLHTTSTKPGLCPDYLNHGDVMGIPPLIIGLLGIPPLILGFKPMKSAIEVTGSVSLRISQSRQSYPLFIKEIDGSNT